MLFASIYYVGRSMPHELYTISVFFFFNLFLLIAQVLRKFSSSKLTLTIAFILFILLIAYPAWQRKDFLSAKLINKYERIKQGKIFSADFDKSLIHAYSKETAMIKNQIKEIKTIIISADETFLFYLTKKKNLLSVNPVVGNIYSKSEMDNLINSLGSNCPHGIAVDCSLVGKCPSYETFSVGDPIILSTLLQRIQAACQIIYQPTVCTDKICIISKP
ncbi:hypothetical protein A2774_04970 [Candidatus Roizmanbacteria bacterium RIFCSPHIGHO2_01_FULL_39_12c]|uniref:Uncharacterized protein n=1 Tax=Candidatus Roizmanbacteria bacterium RIFCSPHIGHO2_01_FULL_39_12c TaxID=1802031 RepID=A0A1F7GBB1_9BACT|nr:MAG: hypothetical protein A2774_04970 [Candidatus Roizmanbacteria bacterium RIFCSPHIGHO2_01_FULL_39_12c]